MVETNLFYNRFLKIKNKYKRMENLIVKIRWNNNIHYSVNLGHLFG